MKKFFASMILAVALVVSAVPTAFAMDDGYMNEPPLEEPYIVLEKSNIPEILGWDGTIENAIWMNEDQDLYIVSGGIIMFSGPGKTVVLTGDILESLGFQFVTMEELDSYAKENGFVKENNSQYVQDGKVRSTVNIENNVLYVTATDTTMHTSSICLYKVLTDEMGSGIWTNFNVEDLF